MVGSPKRQSPCWVIFTLAVVGGVLKHWGGRGVFNQLHIGGEGGWRYPSCIAARCYQCAHLWSKGGTEGLHIPVLQCIQGKPPPPCGQKDRNSENITFAILRMRVVTKDCNVGISSELKENLRNAKS